MCSGLVISSHPPDEKTLGRFPVPAEVGHLSRDPAPSATHRALLPVQERTPVSPERITKPWSPERITKPWSPEQITKPWSPEQITKPWSPS
jgi:hypothetical protein